MRTVPLIYLTLILFIFQACQSKHESIIKKFDQLRSEESENYSIVYAYSTYLSTTRSIEVEEALPMILEMISYHSHTEARYCIDNLKRNGIHSWDLLALRGLCYYNELQPGLALIDLEKAIAGDPDNEKIKTLLDQVFQTDNQSHRTLYNEGLILLQREQYDSALYYMKSAAKSKNLDEYGPYIVWIEKIVEGDKMITADAESFTGYMQKSQGLASMGLFDASQRTLTEGLEKIPDNLNLILAKALVWVQAGQKETATQYLQELENRGVVIDPALKQQILQNKQ